MTIIRVETEEHSKEHVDLDEQAVAELRRAAPANALTITPDFTPGRYQLRTSSYVGSISTTHVEVIIKPKVPVRNVLAMLTPDYAALALRDDEMSYATADEFVDAIAALYSRSLDAALSLGMRRQYVREEDWLVALRGRVDFGVQSRAPLPSPIACRFDEYSLDTPHNRLLKAAALRLLRLERVGQTNRGALTRSLQWFGEVADICPPVGPIRRRGFSRLDAHYRTPILLAALIVESTAVSDHSGPKRASSFLVDMNVVFERFVTERFQRSAPPGVEVVAQYPTTLDHGQTVQMRPDIVWLDGGQPRYVADTKYKSPDKSEGTNHDLYQLVSYITALDVPGGSLIYAGPAPESTGVELLIGPSAKLVSIVTLDLSGSLAGMHQQLDSLTLGRHVSVERKSEVSDLVPATI